MVNRKVLVFSILPILLGQLLSSASSATNYITLVHPIFAEPQIITPNTPFTIEMDSFLPIGSISSINLTIESLYGNYSLNVLTQSVQDTSILISASVPSSAINNTLYNFTCTINGMSKSQPNAIDVVSSFLNNYEFGILTDVHINMDSPADFNRTCWNLSHALAELALNGVQFILVTGDLTESDKLTRCKHFIILWPLPRFQHISY